MEGRSGGGTLIRVGSTELSSGEDEGVEGQQRSARQGTRRALRDTVEEQSQGERQRNLEGQSTAPLSGGSLCFGSSGTHSS